MTGESRELSPAEIVDVSEKLAHVATEANIDPAGILMRLGLSTAKFKLGGTPAGVWLDIVRAVHAGASKTAGYRADATARLLEKVAAEIQGNAELNELAFQLGRDKPQRAVGTHGIFLSYASANRADVDQLYVALQDANPQVEMFQDHRSITLGQDWLNVIRDNAGSAALMVCWVTADYLKSAFCNYEIGLAENRGTTIIPVFAESEISSQAPSYLRLHGIKLAGPLDFAALAGTISAAQKWNIPAILNRFSHSNRQISDRGMRNQSRLNKKIDDLQRQWELLNNKLFRLKEQLILETRFEERFRLEQSIDDTKTQCDQVEEQLKDMESQLIQDQLYKEVADRNDDQSLLEYITSRSITLKVPLEEEVLKLNLSNKDLTIFPPDIFKYEELEELYLCNNQIEHLPPNISKLSKLKWLDLSNNKLTSIPYEISQLFNLEWLDLRGNPLPIHPEIVKLAHMPNQIIKFYFQLQASGNKRPINEAKLIIVGQGDVGKTLLVKRLVENKFDEDEKRTEGIVTTKWLVDAEQKTICVNIWDFGGQEIMHATHQFFLTKRSLYLIVLNARQGEQESRLEYWLKLVQSFSDNSPVIIVIIQPLCTESA